jgi:menaquinone-9 beta-reductase
MAEARSYDVVIAGAGPAGLATALYLLRRSPQLAGRIAALDKARHPRFKVCAGGLIPKTRAALSELGLDVGAPAVEVFGGIAHTESGTIDLDEDAAPLCTIVRRDQFDASLARVARDRGLELFEETKITRVREVVDAVEIETSRGAFRARILVGADGSGSRVRRDLFGQGKQSVGRALMVDVAVDPRLTAEFARRLYRFDFNCVSAGVRGYSWSFPCLIDGRPHLNLGIYDQRPQDKSAEGQSKPSLISELRAAFPAVALYVENGAPVFKAFPIRWYDPADTCASGRAILVGDAAGVDPLMGEGLSFAFDHGKLAAKAIVRFLEGDEAAFRLYDRELHEGAVGRKLRRLGHAARRFYGPHHRLYFKLAAISGGAAQKIGVDWYNGARGVDELSILGAFTKWAGAVLLRRPPR